MDEFIKKPLSIEETKKILNELYMGFLELDAQMKAITHDRQRLTKYAKDNGINVKALKESIRKLKEPSDERGAQEGQVTFYISLLEESLINAF